MADARLDPARHAQAARGVAGKDRGRQAIFAVVGQGDGLGNKERYPDFVKIAKGYGCGAAYIRNKADLVPALEEMINYDGPYVLDVEVPYQEHVLPMIPGGQTVRDMIKE